MSSEVEPEVVKKAPTLSTSSSGQTNNVQRPWLTKNMLKPTGFEPFFADAPITPADHETEVSLYSPELLFETRIETAIQRYTARRKFHSDTKNIFDSFLSYGGIDCKPRQFTGGLTDEDIGEKNAEFISAAKANHFVAEYIEQNAEDWIVDFAGVAAGFLSTETILRSSYNDVKPEVLNHTNILSNFYRYLVYHNVCPEYMQQIKDTFEVVRIANAELAVSIELCSLLPDEFSKACSAVSGGTFAALVSSGDNSWDTSLQTSWTVEDAEKTIVETIRITGTEEQKALVSGQSFPKMTKTTEIDLEFRLVDIDNPSSSTGDNNSNLSRIGSLKFRRLNKLLNDFHATDKEIYTFPIRESSILSKCFLGMVLECTICENSVGLKWIDRIRAVNPSYYKVIANDFFDKKSPGKEELPKVWYRRERNIVEKGYVGRSYGDDDDIMNDEVIDQEQ